jgi:hypothetical protein
MTLTLSERRVGAQRPRLHLAPSDTVSSAGAEAEKLARSCGLVLDDWQSWCLNGMLAERDDGSWGAETIALILPRQNGKNAVLEALELAAIFLFGEQFIIHSAHLNETARTHMERMKALVKSNPELDKLARFYDSNGKERMVRRDTGAEIRFMTRGQKTLRGGSPSRIVFDEALFLTGAQVQAIVPSLAAQSLNETPPQMIYTSSAPLPESSVLHRIRRRGIEGTARNMFFAEWGCELGVDPTDRDAWYGSNPGMGVRIGEQWVEDNELTILEPDGFLIERLGVVFPEVDDTVAKDVKLPADKWAATVTQHPPQLDPGEITLAFDVAKDGAWATIGIAAGDIRSAYVEVIEHRKDVGWLPARLVELVTKWAPIAVGCNGAGPAGAQVGPILQAFRDAGLSADLVHQLSATEYKQACGGFYTDVVEGRLRRPDGGQGPLDVAAADAAERSIGMDGGWAWDFRSATVPISPLVAVTIARSLLPTERPVVYDPLTSVL